MILSPNPVSSNLIVNTYDSIRFTSVTVHNMSGQKVKEFGERGYNKSFSFNLSDLKEGLYFIILRTENGKVVKKIIKE